MYASLYKMPKTSLLDNRKFINENSIVYEAPPKVNKYVPDETIEEKVNYSYGPNLKDTGAGEVYSYRYDAHYMGNRDVENGIQSIVNSDKSYIPDRKIQFNRFTPIKESYQENPPKESTKEYKDIKVNVTTPESPAVCSYGSCGSSDDDGVKNVCGSNRLFPIMDPRFNLREAAKNMILLEDHLFHAGKRCQDCILKHCLTIEGFLEEGITLDKKCQFTDQFLKAFNDFREVFIKISTKIKDGSLTDDDCLKIAQSIRNIRKPLCQNYATFIS